MGENPLHLSCTSCISPQISAEYANPTFCNNVVTATYTIGDLNAHFAVLVKAAQYNVAGSSPTTGNSVDNNNANVEYNPQSNIGISGYNSLQYWMIEDTCREPMSGLNAFEAFPDGFTFDLAAAASSWVTPMANNWVTGTGGWVDTIGESTTYSLPTKKFGRPIPGSGFVYKENPPPENPQSPLSSEAVYHGLQIIWAGLQSSDNNAADTSLGSQTQTHYIDHGLSQ